MALEFIKNSDIFAADVEPTLSLSGFRWPPFILQGVVF